MGHHTGWHKIMCTYKRAGRKKAVKVLSHRLDRRVKASKLRDWEKDY
ncbi:hypothetical protein SEA_PERIWINKLE_50 [Gordonia phage Periwinkle]|nr:hypothetical protein SEA_PERIWINKLE_50 [Gordonia phage Periwinkle]